MLPNGPLLARIYEIRPLTCPRCHGPMCLIAFLTEPPTIRAILAHLGEPITATEMSVWNSYPLSLCGVPGLLAWARFCFVDANTAYSGSQAVTPRRLAAHDNFQSSRNTNASRSNALTRFSGTSNSSVDQA